MKSVAAKRLILGCLLPLYAGAVLAGPLKVVAAENFYGDIARQIGGDRVTVVDILSDPNQDPHLFEASPSVARALAQAGLVIYSGASYDPWVSKLLGGGPPTRRVINVAELAGLQSSVNPHIWYDPHVMIRLARRLAEAFKTDDDAHAREYDQRLDRFLNSMRPLEKQIEGMRVRYRGTPVAATEPVFGYMAKTLDLDMRNRGFQRAMMNDTEPGPSQVAAFEDDLRNRKVKVLLYNSQVTDATTTHLKELAQSASIPIIGITETEPAGKSYQRWMLDQLQTLAQALESARQ